MKSRKRDILSTLLGITIFGLFIWFLASPHGSGETNSPSPFRASLLTHKTIDPATAYVEISVTNTDTIHRSPKCLIEVESAAGTYSGYGSITGSEIAPGETAKYGENITVTKEGAAYITTGRVTCEEVR